MWRCFQEAKTPRAFGGLEAEQTAGRQTGILGERLDVFTGGKAPAHFPQVHRAGRDAQVGGDLFQEKAVALPPRFEDNGKVPAHITAKSPLPGHMHNYVKIRPRGEDKRLD